MKVGYLIPEFPGQTHIWMWREISHLREWNVPIVIFSTRRPAADVRARHAFAEAAQSETIYLWPLQAGRALAALLWVMLRHPVGFLRALWLGLSLPTEKLAAPLLVPACGLAWRCRQLGIERLHSQTGSNSAVLCMMVKRMMGIPFSMVINSHLQGWGGAMAQKFVDCQFTVTHARWLADEIRCKFPDTEVILAPVGVDTNLWVPGPPTHGRSVLSVGRLHVAKGHDCLLRAMKNLADRGVEFFLRIAGAGPEESSLKRLADELGLAERVRFLGSISEQQIIDEMKTADLFVLASRAEPLGVAYMEAMAMGVATIGTNAGGVSEIITDGVDGILVPPNDPAALADAILALLSDQSRRLQLGEAGRAKIVRCFDSRLGAAILYERLLNRPAPIDVPVDSRA